MSKLRTGTPRSTTIQRRFVFLALLAVLPLVALTLFLGFREYRLQLTNVLAARDSTVRTTQLALEGLAAVTRAEVTMLGNTLGSDIDIILNDPSRHPQPAFVQPDDGYLLNQSPDSLRDGRQGTILGRRETVLTRPSGRAELAAINRLFAVQAATHLANSRLSRTYFASNSKDLVAIYPWDQPEVLLGPATGHAAAFARLFESEAFNMYRNEARDPRQSFWTPVHLDFLQNQRVLTFAAPVEVWGVRYGFMAAQLPIGELARILVDLDIRGTAVSVIDQQNDLFATSSLSLAAEGVAFISKTFAEQLQPGVRGVIEEQYVSVSMIRGTPWRLVTMTPAPIVRAQALEATMPYGLALAGVFSTIAAVLILLQMQLIRPATRLVNYIAADARYKAADARGSSAPVPKVPEAWRPLSEKLAQASRNREAHIQQLRAMIDGIPLRAVYVDHNYIYRDANKEFLDFVGMSLDELAGKSVGEVLGDKILQEYKRLTPSILREGVARFEGWVEYIGRGRLFLQVSILPLKALDEEQPGLLTFTRDLTNLKKAEDDSVRNIEALAASELMHRSVVTSSLDAIIVMDEQGIAREFNPAAEAIFGYSAAEAIGRSVSELIVPPELRVAHQHGLEHYLASGNAKIIGRRIEIDGMRKDGSLVPLELSITEVTPGGRRLFISHLRDLVEQKAKTLEINEQRDKLHQAEKMTAMGSLLAGVAHELNNPLAVVVAQSTLLEELAESPATKKRAERIHAAADRCGRIVKTFLAMARQQAPSRTTAKLSQIIESGLSVTMYGLRTSGVEVQKSFAKEELLVSVDTDQLSQVVSNLLINAQQAMAMSEQPRKVIIETGSSGPDRAFIRISDSGPGVPNEIRDRIFDAYFTTKPAGVGTGIGLSVCQKIVNAHGGTLTLEEATGTGASFLLDLPATVLAESAGDAHGQAPFLTGRTILVVDDEPDVGGTLADMLESLGARTVLAESCAEAIKLMDRNPFDLVMSDLRMPDGGGLLLHDTLVKKNSPLAANMVFVTGDTVAGPSIIANTVNGKTQLILEKPFARDEISSIVQAALARGRSPDAT